MAVTTIPLVADVMADLPVRRWVYCCVDDFGAWPGLDGATLRRMEERLVEQADVLVAVSDTLRERLTGKGEEVHLLSHGVDIDFWAQPAGGEALPQLAGLERPLVVFWGLIDRRMDVEMVGRLAASLPRGTIAIAGPEADPDPALGRLPRVARLGLLPFDRLPGLAQEAAVLIMPYADLAVTRAMQPLKLKEYLATGRPAVVRDLPANRAWGDCLDLVRSPEEFAAAVLLRLQTGLPDDQRQGRRRLADESWAAKARAFEQLILDEK